MDFPVIGTGHRRPSSIRNEDGIDRWTKRSRKMTAIMADFNRIKLIHRGLEPVASWEANKYIKQNRGCNGYSGQTGPSFPIGIPNPYPNGKIW
jgi:hypothetical protein